MAEQRLPIVNGDDGTWGDILNQYITKEHYQNPTLTADDPDNGGHETITVRAGTTAAGTSPLKFTSGPLMTATEVGAVEFLTDRLYFTQTTTAIRKTIAAYDDTSGATGDLHYRDSGANFTRLAVGTARQVLTVSSGLPSWQTAVLHTPTAVWGDNMQSSSVVAGTVSYVRVPYAGEIISWYLVANVAITATIDVWKAAGSLPTVANTITASAKPGLSTATTATSSTLTGWTTTVAAGDVFGFKLDTLTSGAPTSITLVLNIG